MSKAVIWVFTLIWSLPSLGDAAEPLLPSIEAATSESIQVSSAHQKVDGEGRPLGAMGLPSSGWLMAGPAGVRKKSDRPQEPPPSDTHSTVRLTIHVTPADSIIRIMNIKPRYRPGMALPEGAYDILVQRSGYRTHRQWFTVDQETPNIDITLEKNHCPYRHDGQTVEIGRLVWQKSAAGYMSWHEAHRYVKNLPTSAHEKWRLPYSGELLKLYRVIKTCPDMFDDIDQWYWASEEKNPLFAYLVSAELL